MVCVQAVTKDECCAVMIRTTNMLWMSALCFDRPLEDDQSRSYWSYILSVPQTKAALVEFVERGGSF